MLSVFLSGCFWVRDCDVPYEKAPIELDGIPPLELRELRFTEITERNQAEIFKMLRDKGIDPVLMGLTDVMYENLSFNHAEKVNIIFMQRRQIETLKEYYKSDKKPTEDKEDE